MYKDFCGIYLWPNKLQRKAGRLEVWERVRHNQKIKFHPYLHAPFRCMKRARSKMSPLVQPFKCCHWQSHSEQLKLCTIWLCCSILMSQSFPASSILFQMSDNTSKLNNTTCSGAWRSQLTFQKQKPKKGGQQIVGPTAVRWFGLTEQHFLIGLAIHAYITCWYITCHKYISCNFTSSYYAIKAILA